MSQTITIEGLPTRLMVGLEIHVELATRSKMWTGAANLAHPDHFESEPNSIIDPIVIGMPGSLPVMNREAVAMSIRVGLAIGCEIAKRCKWDRKSYCYPDLPKNYQISQYDLPLCGEGVLETPISDEEGAERLPIRILRAHLEEDAGKLLHEAPGGRKIDHSIVDLNRAGTPLLEIVTEPDFTSASQAVEFCRALRNIVRYLGVSEAIMQRGHMRFEPNINVIIEKDGQEFATPIVEIKNLNSFKAVRDSIDYEHVRQVHKWLEDGKVMGPRMKQTHGWNDAKGVTVFQRHNEDEDEYRYFPDPDLVAVEVSEQWKQELSATIGELPLARADRYRSEWSLSTVDARTLTEERSVSEFFEAVCAEGVSPKRAAAVCTNNLAKRANETSVLISDLSVTPAQVGVIEAMFANDKIHAGSADELYGLCCQDGTADPQILAEQNDLMQESDSGALDTWAAEAIAAEPKAADDVRNGNPKAIGRLIGAMRKASGGKANPKASQEAIRKQLGV
jgi:aspartyl-tRNA(Asn)/glutamyl-tRNA(Gln) amidotransferase subunit B